MRECSVLLAIVLASVGAPCGAQVEGSSDAEPSNLRLLHEIEVPGWSPGGDLPVELMEEHGAFLRLVAPHTVEVRSLVDGSLRACIQPELEVRTFGLFGEEQDIAVFGRDESSMALETWGFVGGRPQRWAFCRLDRDSPVARASIGWGSRSQKRSLALFVDPDPTGDIRTLRVHSSPNWPKGLGHPGRTSIRHIALTNDGSRFAWIDQRGDLAVVDCGTLEVIEYRQGVEAAAMALDDDGNVHVISESGVVRAYGHSIDLGSAARRVSFSTDRRRCAIDLPRQRILLSEEGPIRQPVPHAQHRTLLGDDDHELRIWSGWVEWQGTRLDQELLEVPYPYEDVVVSGDGRLVAAKVWRREEMLVFDAEDGELLSERAIPALRLLERPARAMTTESRSIRFQGPDGRLCVLRHMLDTPGEVRLQVTPGVPWFSGDQPEADWPRSELVAWAATKVPAMDAVDAVLDPEGDAVLCTVSLENWNPRPRTGVRRTRTELRRIPLNGGDVELVSSGLGDTSRLAIQPETGEIWCFSSSLFRRVGRSSMGTGRFRGSVPGVLATLRERCLGFLDRDRLLVRLPTGFQILDPTKTRAGSAKQVLPLGEILEEVDLGAPAIGMDVDASRKRLVIATPQKLFVYEVLED